MRIVRLVVTLVLVVSATGAGGCRSLVVDMIARTPNYDAEPGKRYETNPMLRSMLGIDRELFVTIDEPAATIRAWVIEPPEDAAEPRGTIVLLHGIKLPSWVLRLNGKALARAGYRVAMVDLRGQGGSTGRWHTYGETDHRDVIAMIDRLEAEGLITGRLGIWGWSYGAATALRTASVDKRVSTVVAVTPFASVRASAKGFIRAHIPFDSRWSDDDIDDMVDEAAVEVGIDPDAVDIRLFMPDVTVPVLIIGGHADHTTPVWQSYALFDLAPAGSRLITMTHELHWVIGLNTTGWMIPASVEWFDDHLPTDR